MTSYSDTAGPLLLNGVDEKDLSSCFFRWWRPLYGVALMVFLVLTPPFQVPDEPNHFLRVCQLAQGQWRPTITAEAVGGELPAALDEMRTLLKTNIAFHWKHKFDPSLLQKAWFFRADWNHRQFYAFPNTAIYTPVAYIPHIVGVRLAQLFTDRPLVWFCLARLCAAATVWLLAGLCLRIAPAPWRAVFALLLMSPMLMFEAIGITADSMTNMILFLFMALLLRVGYSDSLLSRRQMLGLGVLSLALAFCKAFYVLAVFLLAALPSARFPSARRRWLWIGAVVILLLILLQMWWLASFSNIGTRVSVIPGRADPDIQSAFIKQHPLTFPKVVLRNFQQTILDLVRQWVGVLGWLDVVLPSYIVLLHLAVCFFLAMSVPSLPRFTRFWPLLAAAIPIATTLAIMLGGYLTFTPPRHPIVLGIQGRYFLPWGPLAALLLRRLLGTRSLQASPLLRLAAAMTCGALCFLVAALWLLRRYYLA
jgi:uncharacterized membrane protein